jgi:tol-pal system protein YbgF
MKQRLSLPLLLVGLVIAGQFASGRALAGPAEDALAQAADLRKALVAQEDRIARLESQLKNQGLLNLLNQVESLKAEVARLRGGQEEQAYKLELADKRTRDLFADLDGRVKELASRPLAPPPDAVRLQVAPALVSATPPAAPIDSESEARAYETAQSLVKVAKYKEAVAAFQAFLKQYPNGQLAANAWYWTGFAHAGMSDLKAALASFQRLLKDFPTSPKAPDAMLSMARAQIQMNEPDLARATLEQLIDKHPQSKAAESGKKLLTTLK